MCINISLNRKYSCLRSTEILKELENIKTGVTPEELDFARSSMVRKFPSQFESDGQIASNLSLLAIQNLPHDYFDKYTDNIRNVSIEEVNQAAVNNIAMDEMSIVLVGDKNKLLDSFSSAGIGEVKIINEKGEDNRLIINPFLYFPILPSSQIYNQLLSAFLVRLLAIDIHQKTLQSWLYLLPLHSSQWNSIFQKCFAACYQ